MKEGYSEVASETSSESKMEVQMNSMLERLLGRRKELKWARNSSVGMTGFQKVVKWAVE